MIILLVSNSNLALLFFASKSLVEIKTGESVTFVNTIRTNHRQPRRTVSEIILNS